MACRETCCYLLRIYEAYCFKVMASNLRPQMRRHGDMNETNKHITIMRSISAREEKSAKLDNVYIYIEIYIKISKYQSTLCIR